MTARAEYTAEEWGLLRFTPFAVGMAVAFVDGGGLIETLRESVALVVAQAGGLQRYPHNELIRALLTDRSADDVQADARRNLAAQAPSDAAGYLMRAALDDCRRVVALLEDRSDPVERQGYLHLIVDVARATALAARSGGLFSRGPLVDEQERSALEQIAAALCIDVGEMPVGPRRADEADATDDVVRGGDAGQGGEGTIPPSPDAVPGSHDVPSGPIEPG